jgi:hypothetical protein
MLVLDRFLTKGAILEGFCYVWRTMHAFSLQHFVVLFFATFLGLLLSVNCGSNLLPAARHEFEP